ncbi:hypothetical protein CAOG_01142 [Capsaspora owczarzaki ATCC 30864]|uniref:hypothetical protein n=1 Tax=Capsaspora owczarzaki (strain ATCC 30864) TaxID=595528 RepID=UPI0001FE2DE1|nr:hypothetical protein CAOG_01142 [Capsaspora owczarzaki ATCC 30864]|eukprot:XP_004366013.1 hypothetical protein CAOG_01142 [Capsaspora owczarzaki ATCC 30864]
MPTCGDLTTDEQREVQLCVSNLKKSIECPICCCSLVDPYSTPCNHQFCKTCILEHEYRSTKDEQEAKRSKKAAAPARCPMCKQPFTRRALKQSPRFAALVESVTAVIEGIKEDTGGEIQSQRVAITNTTCAFPVENLSQMYPQPEKPHAEPQTVDDSLDADTPLATTTTTTTAAAPHHNTRSAQGQGRHASRSNESAAASPRNSAAAATPLRQNSASRAGITRAATRNAPDHDDTDRVGASAMSLEEPSEQQLPSLATLLGQPSSERAAASLTTRRSRSLSNAAASPALVAASPRVNASPRIVSPRRGSPRSRSTVTGTDEQTIPTAAAEPIVAAVTPKPASARQLLQLAKSTTAEPAQPPSAQQQPPIPDPIGKEAALQATTGDSEQTTDSALAPEASLHSQQQQQPPRLIDPSSSVVILSSLGQAPLASPSASIPPTDPLVGSNNSSRLASSSPGEVLAPNSSVEAAMPSSRGLTRINSAFEAPTYSSSSFAPPTLRSPASLSRSDVTSPNNRGGDDELSGSHPMNTQEAIRELNSNMSTVQLIDQLYGQQEPAPATFKHPSIQPAQSIPSLVPNSLNLPLKYSSAAAPPSAQSPVAPSLSTPLTFEANSPLHSRPQALVRAIPSTRSPVDSIHVVPRIVMTGLAPEQLMEVRALANLLHGKMLKDFNTTATHLVAACDNSFVVRRTIKFFFAIMTGTWLVGCQWVRACLKENRHVAEEEFEIRGDINFADHGPRRARLSLQCNEPKLFDGYEFHFHGQHYNYTRENLVELVCLGGARILHTTEELTDRVVAFQDTLATEGISLTRKEMRQRSRILIVVDKGCSTRETLSLASSGRVQVVFSDWILDCITDYRLRPLGMYVDESTYDNSQDDIEDNIAAVAHLYDDDDDDDDDDGDDHGYEATANRSRRFVQASQFQHRAAAAAPCTRPAYTAASQSYTACSSTLVVSVRAEHASVAAFNCSWKDPRCFNYESCRRCSYK